MSGPEREAGKRRLAVALEYDGSGAPRVTAKGAGEVAQKILDLAEQHGVPLQENRELVEMLAQMPLESEIPEQLYRVVAEVIAFAYLVRGKLPAGFDGDR
jgi:flagellar biosynthesis protein